MVEDLAATCIDDVPYIHMYDTGSQDGITPDRVKHCQPLMKPLVQPPMVPIVSKANEKMAVHARVTSMMHPPASEIDRQTKSYITEFVEHFAPKIKLRKWATDQVLAKQDTASKIASVSRSILESDDEDEPTRETFTKQENDGGESSQWKLEPRIITPLEGSAKARYMAFIYPFKEAVTLRLPCIVVGKATDEVENSVMRVARAARNETVYETDLSRMDGRKSIVGRVLFAEMLAHSFEGDERREMLGLHRQTVGMQCRTRCGVKYSTGFTLGSGSPDTTDNNSWDTLFMLYHAKRLEGVAHREAITWLLDCVLVSGDDGLAAELDVKCFSEACRLCGHVEKCQTRTRETFTFLGRLYAPAALSATVRNSMQDPARVFTKFTICATRLTSVLERRDRLFQKACAVLTTDPETPYISTVARCICDAAEREEGKEFKVVETMLNYNIAGGIYANHSAEWMEAAIHEAHPTCDWDSLDAWFAETRTLDEIENHPPFCVPKEHDNKGCTIMTGDLNHKDFEVVKRGDDSAIPDLPKVDGNQYKEALDTARKDLNRKKKRTAVKVKAGKPTGQPHPGKKAPSKAASSTLVINALNIRAPAGDGKHDAGS